MMANADFDAVPSLSDAMGLEKPKMRHTITTTPSELMDRGLWDELCRLRDWSPYIVNEGLMPDDEEIVLTEEEARGLGLL